MSSKVKAPKSKFKDKSALKTKLSQDDKKFGKTQIYLLLGMIVIGLALALYNLH